MSPLAAADEWYAVEGSPASREAFPDNDYPSVHRRVVQILPAPGPVEHGNKIPVGF